MWCGVCSNELHECVCPDLEEHLAKIGQMKHVAVKWCVRCDKHYAACKCENPDWVVKCDGKNYEL